MLPLVSLRFTTRFDQLARIRGLKDHRSSVAEIPTLSGGGPVCPGGTHTCTLVIYPGPRGYAVQSPVHNSL